MEYFMFLIIWLIVGVFATRQIIKTKDNLSKNHDMNIFMSWKKKVNYAEQRKYPDKSLESKVSSKSKLCKVKQDNNLSFAHNVSSDKDSYGKCVSLEETICKIIQSVFENYLPYIIQQVKKCEPEPIPAQGSGDESIDDPMKIDFVQKKEPSTSIATIHGGVIIPDNLAIRHYGGVIYCANIGSDNYAAVMP